jgi:creatinine amidohydrolase
MMSVTDPKVHMGMITGGEAREIMATNPVIFLPLGSHEDQGPHAPMGDYLLAEKIAELAAVQATAAGTRTLVAPVLPFGGADFFGSMPGGIAISQATLTAVLTDLITSLHRNGLTRIIVINGHGGNVGPINTVCRAVHRDKGLVIPSLYLWRIAFGLMPGLLGADHAAKVAGHGADPLTSLSLHLMPQIVRTDMIPASTPLKRDPLLDLPFTGLGTASFEGADVDLPHEYDDVYTQGVGTGDPRLSSAETGKLVADQLAGICARFAGHFAMRTG